MNVCYYLPCNIPPFGQYSQVRGEDVAPASCLVDPQGRQCPRCGPRRLTCEYWREKDQPISKKADVGKSSFCVVIKLGLNRQLPLLHQCARAHNLPIPITDDEEVVGIWNPGHPIVLPHPFLL